MYIAKCSVYLSTIELSIFRVIKEVDMDKTDVKMNSVQRTKAEGRTGNGDDLKMEVQEKLS